MFGKYRSKDFIIDLVSPLIAREKYISEYQKGGFSVVGVTLAVNDGYDKTIATIEEWNTRFITMKDKLFHIRRIEDIEEARNQGKLGILFHFQNTAPLESDIKRVAEFFALGVRIIQLTYNNNNPFGSGCECEDTGLTDLGRDLIDEMERCKMLLDLSHSGKRTAREAVEYAKKPCILSHSNVYAICPSDRNVSDELISRVAEKGGMIGVNAFSPLVTNAAPQATLAQFVDHIDYLRKLVGVEHISLGLDYYTGQWPYVSTKAALKNYESLVAKGVWKAKNYPKPPHKYAKGLETPRKIANLRKELSKRGYSEQEQKAILGENIFRFLSSFWL